MKMLWSRSIARSLPEEKFLIIHFKGENFSRLHGVRRNAVCLLSGIKQYLPVLCHSVGGKNFPLVSTVYNTLESCRKRFTARDLLKKRTQALFYTPLLCDTRCNYVDGHRTVFLLGGYHEQSPRL